jgi:hypothetical protein
MDTWARHSKDHPQSRVTRVREISATNQPPLDVEVGRVVSRTEIEEFEVDEALVG